MRLRGYLVLIDLYNMYIGAVQSILVNMIGATVSRVRAFFHI